MWLKTRRGVALLLNLQWIIKVGGFNNLTTMLVNCTTTFGGLCDGDSTSKLVYFGANGVMVFQGLKIGVTIQLEEKHVLYVDLLRRYDHS
jgi:hypothetical protein